MSELHHISNHDLNRYHLAGMTGLERAMVEEHLRYCLHCLRRAEENLRSIREKGREHLGHISTDNLEKYKLGRITEAHAIARIDRHLTECIDCAHRMLAVERFIQLVLQGVVRDDLGIVPW
jgi:hypothetical protein